MELAPLSDLFVVYTRQSNQAALLLDQDFGDVFQNSYRSPLTDAFVVKLRYEVWLLAIQSSGHSAH